MRRVVGLLVTMGIAVLLAAGAGLVSGLGPSGMSVAEAQSTTTQMFAGVFAERVGDPLKEGSDGKHLSGDHKVDHVLTDDRGRTTELQLDEEVAEAAGGADALNGKPVAVEGTKTSSGEIKVEKIREDEQSDIVSSSAFEAEAAVQGSQPAATVLCRFGDSTGITPHAPSWFNTLVSGGSKPSVDHFWREVSFNNINLNGSQAFGWYDLPKPRSQYLDSFGNAKLQLLAEDCTAKADPNVNFPSYPTINMMFNQDLDGSAWGGGITLTRDGQTRTYGATWMPPWGYENVGILGHEMGHSYGLPHSSGPYGAVYDSWWDVMSSAGLGTGCNKDATYGCMAMHTISAHKDRVGWIPASRKYTATTASNQNITIERLGTSASGNYQMAKIPIKGSSTVFYTLEARRFVGYDGYTKGEGIVVHKVNTTSATGLKTIAYVVDSDNNSNPNDAGAMWTAGETFTDSANGISFKVNSATASGYDVTVNPGDGENTTAPRVQSSKPYPNKKGVGLKPTITANFSEEMDKGALSTSNVQLYRSGTNSPVGATVTPSSGGKSVALKPTNRLKRGKWYQVVLWRDSVGIKDLAGNPLAGGGKYSVSTSGNYVYWWFKVKR